MKRRRALAFVAVAAAAAGAGLGAGWWWRSRAGGGVAAALLAARFTDLEGRARTLASWRGRVLVVNFWATWCAPCREEMPLFVRVQEREGARGVQFVGIALDEPARVRTFARELGVNYPLLIGKAETLDLVRLAGNRAAVLPYTLVLDRNGNVAAREVGALKEARLAALLEPLLANSGGSGAR